MKALGSMYATTLSTMHNIIDLFQILHYIINNGNNIMIEALCEYVDIEYTHILEHTLPT